MSFLMSCSWNLWTGGAQDSTFSRHMEPLCHPQRRTSLVPSLGPGIERLFSLFFSSGEHLGRKETITLGGGRRVEGAVGSGEEGWRTGTTETRDIWKTLGTSQEKHPSVQCSADGLRGWSQPERDRPSAVCLSVSSFHQLLWPTGGATCSFGSLAVGCEAATVYCPCLCFLCVKAFFSADRVQVYPERKVGVGFHPFDPIRK